MRYYPGALHIHTTFSDGSGTMSEVVRAARDAGLRWIIVTDHDTLEGRPQAGWHDDVLVIVGHEITPDRNHFLALNTPTVVNNQLPPQDFINEVYGLGGFGIIAHPDEAVKNSFKDIYRWEDWQVNGPQPRANRTVGIELWNLMSDWAEHLTERNKELIYFFPRLALEGPTAATLAWWDALNVSGKRTFGVGGVDVHAFKRHVPWGNIEIFSYRWMFRTLTNYLLLPDLLDLNNAEHATHQVYAALAAGQSYFVNRYDGACPALIFQAERDNQYWQIGANPTLATGPLTIHADVGSDAQLALIGNGQVIARGIHTLRHTITTPGVYRLEAFRKGRPWLYTNPLFIGE
jgi:hypothetical protein